MTYKIHLLFDELKEPNDLIRLMMQATAFQNNIQMYTSGKRIESNCDKVIKKLNSWNVRKGLIQPKHFETYRTAIDYFKRKNLPLIGTSPNTNSTLSNYKPTTEELVLIFGGKNGLSKGKMSRLDEILSVEMNADMDFLTRPDICAYMIGVLNEKMKIISN